MASRISWLRAQNGAPPTGSTTRPFTRRSVLARPIASTRARTVARPLDEPIEQPGAFHLAQVAVQTEDQRRARGHARPPPGQRRREPDADRRQQRRHDDQSKNEPNASTGGHSFEPFAGRGQSRPRHRSSIAPGSSPGWRPGRASATLRVSRPRARPHLLCGSGGMADALASGASPGNRVEVQVLSSAPLRARRRRGERPRTSERRPTARALLRLFLHPSSGLALRLASRRATSARSGSADGRRVRPQERSPGSLRCLPESRARRPAGKARGASVSGIRERRATHARRDAPPGSRARPRASRGQSGQPGGGSSPLFRTTLWRSPPSAATAAALLARTRSADLRRSAGIRAGLLLTFNHLEATPSAATAAALLARTPADFRRSAGIRASCSSPSITSEATPSARPRQPS